MDLRNSEEPRASPYRHLPGMVSGLVVWAVWFVAVYGLAGLGCEHGWNAHRVPGGNLLTATLLVATAAALAAIGWCAARGYAGWRRERRAPGREARDRDRFMGFVMFVLSLVAAVATVMVAIPVLMLDPCAA